MPACRATDSRSRQAFYFGFYVSVQLDIPAVRQIPFEQNNVFQDKQKEDAFLVPLLVIIIKFYTFYE